MRAGQIPNVKLPNHERCKTQVNNLGNTDGSPRAQCIYFLVQLPQNILDLKRKSFSELNRLGFQKVLTNSLEMPNDDNCPGQNKSCQ